MTALTESDLVETLTTLRRCGNDHKLTAQTLGITERQLRRRIAAAHAQDINPDHPNADSPFAIEHLPPVGTQDDKVWEIKSDKNNRYRFGAFGDLHAASKQCRWDIRSDLTKRAEDFEAFAILDSGNWIDGESHFNRYTLEAVGMDNQLDLLAAKYPKTKIPTYAITADDHEGWYFKREGIDVGRHCEPIMRRAGHNWTCLGYLEADILLTNANTGATSILRVMHPSGGSAYATSYRPQKIIESLEGGDKPAVLLIGHYHKLESGCDRNVWYCQTGASQDQTSFLRGRANPVHLGGVLLELQQDPETGAIISFKPDMIKYYNRRYYIDRGRGNNRWAANGPIRQVPRDANTSF